MKENRNQHLQNNKLPFVVDNLNITKKESIKHFAKAKKSWHIITSFLRVSGILFENSVACYFVHSGLISSYVVINFLTREGAAVLRQCLLISLSSLSVQEKTEVSLESPTTHSCELSTHLVDNKTYEVRSSPLFLILGSSCAFYGFFHTRVMAQCVALLTITTTKTKHKKDSAEM